MALFVEARHVSIVSSDPIDQVGPEYLEPAGAES